MRLFSSRKAQDQTLFFTMTAFLVLGVVLFTFLTYINKATSSTNFEKNFLATDLALTIDTMQLAEGNIEITYPLPEKKQFLYEFENSQVKVSDNKLDLKKGTGYFLMNKDTKLKNKEIKPDKLILSKEGNVLFINEQTNLNALQCKKEKVPFIRSLTANGAELANTLNNLAASEFQEGNDLTLNIEIREKQKNYLNIFYQKDREKIACEIANKVSGDLLKEGERFDGVSIIPSNEFNLEFSKNYDIKLQTVIASAIIEGVKNAEK